MKILITGLLGFIGMNLIKRLVSEGHRVVSLDDYETDTKDNHVEGVKYINCDIEMIEYIQGDYDLCFHLTQSRVQPSFDDPTETFRVNVRGTGKQFVIASKNNNVKLIYLGSSSKHHDPTQSPYKMYKYLGEEVCKLYRKSFDVDVEICRIYMDQMRSLDEKFGNVIGIWRTKCFNSEKLPIVGDGEQRRDFTHVDDIVDGLVRISQTNKIHEDGELGSGVNYSVNEMFNMFLEERFPTIRI